MRLDQFTVNRRYGYVERVQLPADARLQARAQREADAAHPGTVAVVQHGVTPHARARIRRDPGIGQRYDYRCGKCGADWQLPMSRVEDAVESALRMGATVIYAEDVES